MIYMLREPDHVYLHVVTRDVEHDDLGVGAGCPSDTIFHARSPNCSQPRGMLEKNQIITITGTSTIVQASPAQPRRAARCSLVG